MKNMAHLIGNTHTIRMQTLGAYGMHVFVARKVQQMLPSTRLLSLPIAAVTRFSWDILVGGVSPPRTL